MAPVTVAHTTVPRSLPHERAMFENARACPAVSPPLASRRIACAPRLVDHHGPAAFSSGEPPVAEWTQRKMV